MIEERYIVDTYNRFHNNENVVETFTLQIGDHLEKWCIRKVPIAGYEWGEPQLGSWPEQDFETNYSIQQLYDSIEDAREFVRDLKRRNGI